MTLPTLINNNQAGAQQNTNIAGVSKYASGDYGVAFATTAAVTAALASVFPSPINGDVATLWNTNGSGAGRLYIRTNSAWKYVDLT